MCRSALPFLPETNPRFHQTLSLDGPSFPSPARPSRTDASPSTTPISYVIVFGYPPDKYSVTVEYFKSLGAATEPEPSTEIVNCFRIGFRDPGEAARVVRRNGEVLGGTWMVGVKWAVCLLAFFPFASRMF